MFKRVLTGIIGLIIFFVILFAPPVVFYVAVCVIIAGMLYEIHKAMNARASIGVVSVLSAALLIFGMTTEFIVPAMIGSVMLYLILSVIVHEKEKMSNILMAAFWTWFIVLFMSTIMNMRHEVGIFGVIMVFLCAWMTDTCAYFAGYLFGKHKLSPTISPKKTIEGAIGGVIGTMISCIIFVFILVCLGALQNHIATYILFAVVGTIASILSQVGDLVASCFKRDNGVKDFGTLFPGHGGILDRFDSVIFIAPVIYYLVTWLIVL